MMSRLKRDPDDFRIRTQIVRDYESYAQLLWMHSKTHPFDLFRGQPVRGNLLPGIARRAPDSQTTATERSMLSQLEFLGASMLNDIKETSLDRLVVAQHFGMKTRLLDWTRTANIALWFACSSAAQGDVYVYALQSQGLQRADAYALDPFAIDQTIAFQPRMNNARILAQDGFFTLHSPGPNGVFQPLELYPFEFENQLFEFQITGESRADILEALARTGMTYKTMYPGLDGLCRHINSEALGLL